MSSSGRNGLNLPCFVYVAVELFISQIDVYAVQWRRSKVNVIC